MATNPSKGLKPIDFHFSDKCFTFSVNECYFAVRGAAIILPHEECIHVYKSLSKNSSANDIQKHLQSMFLLLRPEDTLKMVYFNSFVGFGYSLQCDVKAVKLESIYPNRTRYLIIVTSVAHLSQQSCLLGIDYNEEATIGLVLPVWADTRITLDGDGYWTLSPLVSSLTMSSVQKWFQYYIL